MNYNEALKIAQAGRVADIKDFEELRSGLAALHLHYASYRETLIKVAIESFEIEISRRAHLTGLTELHQSAMEQGEKFHGKTMDELGKLKSAVDLLARARCVDKWILAAGWIAAIAALAAVALALFLRR